MKGLVSTIDIRPHGCPPCRLFYTFHIPIGRAIFGQPLLASGQPGDVLEGHPRGPYHPRKRLRGGQLLRRGILQRLPPHRRRRRRRLGVALSCRNRRHSLRGGAPIRSGCQTAYISFWHIAHRVILRAAKNLDSYAD